MGLFDRFKKKPAEEVTRVAEPAENNVEETVQPQVQEEVQEDVAETLTDVEAPIEEKSEVESTENKEPVDDENRRFTILVEKTFQLIEDQGVVIKGEVFGKVMKGDEIYVMFPNGTTMKTIVDEMEIGPGRRTDVAENGQVAIQIRDIKNRNMVPQYTVITNIAPNMNTNDGKEIENPQLLGLSMEYPKLGTEVEYNNLLIYVICHAKYVVPAAIGAASPERSSTPQIKFPSLVDPNDGNRHVLPVFTDWDALTKWKDIFDEEHPAQSVIMSFPEAVSVCKGNGIVINPFGPMTIVVSSENIQQIISMDGYKKEFGEKPTPTTSAAPVNQPNQEPRMLIGVPKNNEEVKAVTAAIVEYAKQEPLVKRVDLLFKMDMQQEKTFICVVDCPEKQANRIFAAINKAASEKLNEVKRIDFLLHGASKLAVDLVTDKSIIYQQ